jgi:hypothetical protein
MFQCPGGRGYRLTFIWVVLPRACQHLPAPRERLVSAAVGLLDLRKSDQQWHSSFHRTKASFISPEARKVPGLSVHLIYYFQKKTLPVLVQWSEHPSQTSPAQCWLLESMLMQMLKINFCNDGVKKKKIRPRSVLQNLAMCFWLHSLCGPGGAGSCTVDSLESCAVKSVETQVKVHGPSAA